MKTALQWTAIVVLLAVYAMAGWAVLHPHVSPDYRAYFIDRVTTDYAPQHYASTPEEGMEFRHSGLPSWVAATRGFDEREAGGGRWTDANLHALPGLIFSRGFSGDSCVELKVYTIPWLGGREIAVRFGNQEQAFKASAGGPATYDLQFHDLQAADRLEILLPSDLPPVAERERGSTDTRRLGISVHNLRILPGQCAAKTPLGQPLLEGNGVLRSAPRLQGTDASFR